MVKSGRALILLVIPLLIGMRDPFQPVPDPCGFTQLSGWHYQGMVVLNEKRVAIVRESGGLWRRLRPDDNLPGGGRIASFNKEEMVIENGQGCLPATVRWKREGAQHEEKRHGSALSVHGDDGRERARQRKGQISTAGDADGG